MFFGSDTKELVLDNLCPQGACTNSFVIIAHVALTVDVFFSFPLIMAPVYEVVELSLFGRTAPETRIEEEEEESIQRRDVGLIYADAGSDSGYVEKYPTKSQWWLPPWEPAHWKKMILRTLLLILTGALGIGISCIGQLLALVSGFTLTFNGFVIGPLIHMAMRYSKQIKKFEGLRDGTDYETSMERSGLSCMLSVWWDAFLILFGIGIGGWTIYLAVVDLVNNNGCGK